MTEHVVFRDRTDGKCEYLIQCSNKAFDTTLHMQIATRFPSREVAETIARGFDPACEVLALTQGQVETFKQQEVQHHGN